MLINTDNNVNAEAIKKIRRTKNIPRSVIRLEKVYNLKDKFKKVTKCKNNNSYMQYETIKLGSNISPQNVNLGKNCSLEERHAYIKLFKEYKDIFTWTYEYLKKYDTNIIQHVIPMKAQTKTFQQKLRKIHPSLEPQVKGELNKLLAAIIIFPVRHTKWISKLVPVRKNNGDIRLCVDFRNVYRASEKYNYLVPPMEQILQCWHVLKASVFLSLMASKTTKTDLSIGRMCQAGTRNILRRRSRASSIRSKEIVQSMRVCH
jgi:hypothetical protein